MYHFLEQLIQDGRVAVKLYREACRAIRRGLRHTANSTLRLDSAPPHVLARARCALRCCIGGARWLAAGTLMARIGDHLTRDHAHVRRARRAWGCHGAHLSRALPSPTPHRGKPSGAVDLMSPRFFLHNIQVSPHPLTPPAERGVDLGRSTAGGWGWRLRMGKRQNWRVLRGPLFQRLPFP
jgi:hypothetical protein